MTIIAANPQGQVEAFYYFPSAVYTIKKPEFLDAVKEVSDEALSKIETEIDDIYPVKMSGNFYEDPRLEKFTTFIGETAWLILAEQGYKMSDFEIVFADMWTQEHYKHSLMEQHIHNYGAQIIGFYFLETPENCSKVIFHDPKPGKVQINLPEKDMTQATMASTMVNFVPEPGMLMFTNSWLPHSFGRHASNDPIKFIHFNLAIRFIQETPITEAEVI